MAYDKKYTDKQCERMIRTMTCPIDAPDWVIRTIRKRRREIDRKIKNPQDEMKDFMKELGGSERIG